MKKNGILLSLGSIPWYGLKRSIQYVENIGYDGLELIPSRIVTSEIKSAIKIHGRKKWTRHISNIKLIKSIHQNWRIDIGLDKTYRIGLPISIFFIFLRLILFPKIKESNKIIKLLSEDLNIPLTVHDLSSKWLKNNQNEELSEEILYEIMALPITKEQLKNWMEKNYHNIVVDSRDDQSLLWAKKNGFNTWQEFWKWIGLKKIKNLQLTFIGVKGLRKIIRREKSLAEEQLLWLYEHAWIGNVTVEVNPLMLIFLYKADMKKGFMEIARFIRQTLIQGKKWS